uniref:acid phosphatase n=1 Tax=Panagrellus redivivus TaxID=6233 RepID=A0A7E4V8L6_PANRE
MKTHLLLLVTALFASALAADTVFDTPSDELIFVQAIWRHGDRSPTETFPNDTYQEKDWPQGWGQLSALGMQQHVDLGQNLRKRYVDTLKFLSGEYKNHEVYVRSTDVNRTLISAMSNLIGMYPDGDQDQVPHIPEWPRNAAGKFWVPIAIHTIDDNVDYTLNPDRTCPYYDQLWSEIEKSDEYLALQKSESDFFAYLTKNTGTTVTPSNLWIIADALFIEQTNNLTLPDWATAVTGNGTYYDKITQINDLVDKWNNGLGLNKVNGIDMAIEVPKVRGGTLLWSIIGHLQQKWACYSNSKTADCGFFNRLKYYIYSAHDTTVASLFSALGFSRTNYNEDGYPHYSSCVTVELWKSSSTGKNYVKFLYWPLVNDKYHTDIEDVTGSISGGPITDIDSLVKRSQDYKPAPTAAEVCNPNQKKGGNAASTLTPFSTAIGFVISFFILRNERA